MALPTTSTWRQTFFILGSSGAISTSGGGATSAGGADSDTDGDGGAGETWARAIAGETSSTNDNIRNIQPPHEPTGTDPRC